MVTIELRNAEKETVIYTQDFVSGLMFRRAITISKELKGDVTEETLDKMVDFVVELFDGQFTSDEFYKGVRSTEMINEISKCISAIVSGLPKSEDSTDPN